MERKTAAIRNILITTIVSGGMILGGILYILCGVNYKVPIIMIFTLGVSLAIYLIKYPAYDPETARNKSLAGFSAMMKMLVLLGSVVEYHNGNAMTASSFMFISHYVMVCALYIVELVFFIKKTDSIKFKYLVLFNYLFIFLVFSTCIDAFWILAAGITVITTYTVYGDKKLIYTVAIGINLINIIAVAKRILSYKEADFAYNRDIHVIEVAIMLIYTMILIYSSKFVQSMNDYMIKEVEEEDIKVKEIIKHILKIGKKVKENIITTNKVVDDLDTAMSSSLSVLSDISESNAQNSDSVDEQSQMSTNISKMLLDVVEEVEGATKVSTESKKGVKRGRNTFKNIKNKSNKIVKNNKEVLDTINEFVKNTNYVRDITKGIADISDQTNLLSLNASIKSFSAGEEGKGFSVVANEIRKLAYETTELTDKINDIFKELEENAMAAQEMINEVVEAVDEENCAIDETMADFTMLEDNISFVNDNVAVVLEKAEQVTQYNVQIENHINSLAISSEQVLESTKEVVELNNSNSNMTSETRDALDELMKSVEYLEKLSQI